jgi:HTH-type transcriptional regulator/antitoxin HigA
MSTAVTVHPIKTDADLAAATRRAWDLRDAPPASPEADEAAVLLDLIEAYEVRAFPLPMPSGRALVAHLMEEHGLTQEQIPEIGPQPIVSGVLAGRRAINARMAVALGKRFKLPAGDFLVADNKP